MAPVGPAALAKARGAAGSARPTRTARVIVADPGRLLRLLPAVAAASDLEHDPVDCCERCSASSVDGKHPDSIDILGMLCMLESVKLR